MLPICNKYLINSLLVIAEVSNLFLMDNLSKEPSIIASPINLPGDAIKDFIRDLMTLNDEIVSPNGEQGHKVLPYELVVKI